MAGYTAEAVHGSERASEVGEVNDRFNGDHVKGIEEYEDELRKKYADDSVEKSVDDNTVPSVPENALTDSGTRDKPRKARKQDLIDFMSENLDDKTDDGWV